MILTCGPALFGAAASASSATVWDPSNKTATVVLDDGNLNAFCTPHPSLVLATAGVASGKWYWEILCSSGNPPMIGIAVATVSKSTRLGDAATAYACDGFNKEKNDSGGTTDTPTGTGTLFPMGTVVGVALDMDLKEISWYQNGVFLASFTGINALTYYPAAGTDSGNIIVDAKFSSTSWTYAPPAGFIALP